MNILSRLRSRLRPVADRDLIESPGAPPLTPEERAALDSKRDPIIRTVALWALLTVLLVVVVLLLSR